MQQASVLQFIASHLKFPLGYGKGIGKNGGFEFDKGICKRSSIGKDEDRKGYGAQWHSNVGWEMLHEIWMDLVKIKNYRMEGV